MTLLATFACSLALSADHIDERSGVPIKFDVSNEMFPDLWKSDEIQALAIGISKNQIDRSIKISESAMAKYPASLLSKNLSSVYFVKELRFYGLKYGGTNSLNKIYITNRGTIMGFTDRFVEATFHHEFSSILLRNFRRHFDETAWFAQNRETFAYGTSGMHALKQGNADTRYHHTFHLDGFLNQYGQASLEEDFNTFAEALFIGDPDFWKAASLFPRIKKKKDIIISFYQSIDPQYTEDYFFNLSVHPR